MSLDPSFINPILLLVVFPGLVWVGFHFLAKSANEDLKHDIAEFFKRKQSSDENPLPNARNSSVVQVHLLFQGLFGEKLISWKSFVRSCAISYAIMLLFGFPFLWLVPYFRQEFLWYLMYSIFLSQAITFYFCLFKSRWVLGKLIHSGKSLVIGFCLFLDSMIATMIMIPSDLFWGKLWGLEISVVEGRMAAGYGNEISLGFGDWWVNYMIYWPHSFDDPRLIAPNFGYFFMTLGSSLFFVVVWLIIYITAAKSLKLMCRINWVEKLVKNFVVKSNWIKAIGTFASLGIFLFFAAVLLL